MGYKIMLKQYNKTIYLDTFASIELAMVQDRLPDNTVYVIGKDKDYRFVIFKCPCGCNESIMISVFKASQYPKWGLAIHEDDTVSLTPSIFRGEGCSCRSHFYLKRNRVDKLL